MGIKYHVAIFGPGKDRHGLGLKRRIRKRLRDLGPSLVRLVDFPSADAILRRDAKSPVVAIYFGGSAHSPEDVDVIRSLKATASTIIPFVEKLSNFRAEVPSELEGINGMALDQGSSPLDALANVVLENLGLLRRARRLFISYRRTDSSDEALQLRHELDSRGYDVFLDTHSVPKGDDFQEVLWHRLADSDVVVLLDTPGFMDSRWTKEELAQAEAMTIGLVQVIWPGHIPAPHTALCEQVRLQPTDFEPDPGRGLTKATLDKIADVAERLRARCLAARHDNLVRDFCDAAATLSISTTVQPERFISVTLPSGKSIAAIPAVGVPDALRYHEANLRFRAPAGSASEVLLIYDHRGLRPRWSGFLDWLDEFLPVKAVRVTNVAKRLVDL